MNAMAYLGQQNIVANSDTTETPITDQNAIGKITYNVNTNPLADTGTWKINGFNDFGQLQNAQWTRQFHNNFNFPISVYLASSYGYSVGVAPSAGRADAATPQVTVKYPVCFGTSVSANFNSSATNNITIATTNSVKFSGGGNTNQALTLESNTGNNTLVAKNGALNNGSTTPDTNLYLTIPSNIIDAIATVTLTQSETATCPQSAWYTVCESGQNSDGTDITWTGYDLTQDENNNNNIFAITANKIARYKGTNADQGYTGSVYTTAVEGWGCKNSSGTGASSTPAVPVTAPQTLMG